MNKSKAFIWNIMGSAMNALSTMLITLIVTKKFGVEAGGLVSYALGLGFVLLVISTFEIRPFQSTDILERYSFTEYFVMRLLTSITMVVICFIYLKFTDYNVVSTLIIFALCLNKMLDGISDVFQGYFQQHNHLEWSGKILFYRIFISNIAFLATVIISNDLLLSCLIMILVSAILLLILDLRVFFRYSKFTKIQSWAYIPMLIKECIPLFLSSFLLMYILNVTKFEIEKFYPELQGYWAPIYLIAPIINLFSIFAFRPVINDLSEIWNNNKIKQFIHVIFKLCLWITISSVVIIIGSYLFGIPILSILYGLDLTPFKIHLIIVVVGGAFNALSTLFFYIITIIRKQIFLLYGNIITFLFAIVISPYLIKEFSLLGAAIAYMITMVLRSVIFTVFFIYIMAKEKNAKR